tara:strand:- start:88 stop:483 length:396 start_codon:yes stop_codon:yes gene_type:complete
MAESIYQTAVTCLTKRNYKESKEQEALIEWFDLSYKKYEKLLVYVPNGQDVGPKTGARLKRTGLRAGFPDLVLFVPSGIWSGLILEFKPTDSGTVGKEQKIMITRLTAQGYCALAVNGLDEAMRIIKDYLG